MLKKTSIITVIVLLLMSLQFGAVAQQDTRVIMCIGSESVYVNSAKVQIDPKDTEILPFTVDGRTLVPARFLAETFDLTVSYDEKTEAVTIKDEARTVILLIGSNKMYINGRAEELDVSAQIYNGRTMVPLRAFAEKALLKTVFYDDRGIIEISSMSLLQNDSKRRDKIAEIYESDLLPDSISEVFVLETVEHAGFITANYGRSTGGIIAVDAEKITFVTTGYNIFGSSDDCTFVYQEMLPVKVSEVSVRVDSLGDEHIFNTGAGIMMRESDDARSKNVYIRVIPDGSVIMNQRTNDSGEYQYLAVSSLTFPIEVKIARNGDTFIGYYKDLGMSDWKEISRVNIKMEDTILGGITGMTATENGRLTAELSDFKTSY